MTHPDLLTHDLVTHCQLSSELTWQNYSMQPITADAEK